MSGRKDELIQRIMQLGHNATVLSGKEESEEGEDSESDEYKSEEKKRVTKYSNLLVLCTGVWKMNSCCYATEQGTIFCLLRKSTFSLQEN